MLTPQKSFTMLGSQINFNKRHNSVLLAPFLHSKAIKVDGNLKNPTKSELFHFFFSFMFLKYVGVEIGELFGSKISYFKESWMESGFYPKESTIF